MGKKIYSPANFGHLSIQKSISAHVEIQHLKLEGRIWFAHVKHSLSDSAYYGARYNIKYDPQSFFLMSGDYITNSLGIDSLEKLKQLGKDLPDGMPFKPLARGYDKITSPHDSFRERINVNRLTRQKISFNSAKNVLILGTDLTARAISDSLRNTPSKITHLREINWPLQFHTWDLLNPDIIFLDLPTIEGILSSESDKFVYLMLDIFAVCDQIFIHQVYQKSSLTQENDIFNNLEKLQLPVEIIGKPEQLENEENYLSYLNFLKRMISNRFDGNINN